MNDQPVTPGPPSDAVTRPAMRQRIQRDDRAPSPARNVGEAAWVRCGAPSRCGSPSPGGSKVVKAGMDTAHVMARFEARARRGGDGPSGDREGPRCRRHAGRPSIFRDGYAGEAVTACAIATGSTRPRLDLFLKVCDGVHHAHQKRRHSSDLKPSNVLVTLLDGHRCRIIDFGVAKAIAQPLIVGRSTPKWERAHGTPGKAPSEARWGARHHFTRR